MNDLSVIMERQRDARYPELLTLAPGQRPELLFSRRRAGTGLVVVGLRHSGLSAAQWSALNRFRLDQYSLCGFYDLPYLRDHRIEYDPDLMRLPPDTIQIIVGTEEGRILAYSYIQPPTGSPRGHMGSFAGPRMEDAYRPWFPCERESFGPEIFSSLPALRCAPVAQIAEVSILLRNQLEHGPTSIYAVAESILAMACIQCLPETNLLATVAYCGHEARQVIYDLGMTALYAPEAPVIYNALPAHWSSAANMPGRFWPSVFSTQDFQERFDHLDELDGILDLAPGDLRRALVRFRREKRRITPRALTPEPGACDITWIATPELVEVTLDTVS